MDTIPELKRASALRPAPLLDRASLIKRWQHGSNAFFWREERAGRLHPVINGGVLRYRWDDVLRYEGGLPSEDMVAEYFADLMHPDQVASVCNCTPGYIASSVRKGALPVRRIGRASRFVPAEVALWQNRAWASRTRRMNGISRKTSLSPPDE